jgi:hypothetical protein
MKTLSFLLAAALLALAYGAAERHARSTAPPPDHTRWVEQSLTEIQKVKVGMTRADLKKVFAGEGGLSTGTRRTYGFRDCPYIKVDVEFDPVGRPERDAEGRVTLEESDADVITKISRPYLDWVVLD